VRKDEEIIATQAFEINQSECIGTERTYHGENITLEITVQEPVTAKESTGPGRFEVLNDRKKVRQAISKLSGS
jgi:hypothetical protein